MPQAFSFEGKPLVVLAGPTAAGKTELSLALARALDGEIISADSMQVYKGMDIGSAKILPSQMQGIPHHLVDILSPWEEFHVVRFQQLVREALVDIYSRGKFPVIVGGTGFYIQAVTKDIDFTQASASDSYREELEKLAQEKGAGELYRLLKEVDPQSALQIHAHNVKRVIRALEFYHQNQMPISQHNAAERERKSPFALSYFVLTMPRQELYRRIDLRVDQMMEKGLLEEVERLRQAGCHAGMVSMQGLGYKELLGYLEGEYSLEEAVRILKRDTRHFAKRQITWFKREEEAIWVDKEQFGYDDGAILDFLLTHINRSRHVD